MIVEGDAPCFSEGFEVVESVVCFMFQVINVFGPGHIALKCDTLKSCFLAEIYCLVIECGVDVGRL